MIQRLRLFSFLLLGLLVLSACADKRVGGCPQVAYLRDVAVVSDYGRDEPTPQNLVASAAITGIEGLCAYDSEGVNVDFKLFLRANKGPRLGGNQTSFPFFIALLKPDDSVSTKDIMTASFVFDEAGKPADIKQDIHVYIPLAEKEDAAGYRVLTGFQLTEGQLNFARENMGKQDRPMP